MELVGSLPHSQISPPVPTLARSIHSSSHHTFDRAKDLSAPRYKEELEYKDKRSKIVKVENNESGRRYGKERDRLVKEHGKDKRGDVLLRGMEAGNTCWERKIGCKKRDFQK